jgi:hypothetical protein
MGAVQFYKLEIERNNFKHNFWNAINKRRKTEA